MPSLLTLLLPLSVLAFITVPLHRVPPRFVFDKFLALGDGDDMNVTNFMDEQYYVEAGLGTPVQGFNLLVDTGSSNLWVPSSSCYSVSCWAHNSYDSQESDTYMFNGTTISMAYESGYCSGVLSMDTLSIGEIALPRVTFAQMNTVSPQFMHVQFDGILGLAWPSLSVDNVPSLLSVAYSEGLIESYGFSLYFTNISSPSPSQLLLGGFNTSLFESDLFNVSVTKTGYWSLPLTGILVGAKEKIPISDSVVIIDSGASGISAEDSVISPLSTLISVNSDCSNVASLPSVTFEIAGKPFTLTPQNYVVVSTIGEMQMCASPFQTVEMGTPMEHFVVLGAAFLREIFTYFDFGEAKVGLAVRKNL